MTTRPNRAAKRRQRRIERHQNVNPRDAFRAQLSKVEGDLRVYLEGRYPSRSTSGDDVHITGDSNISGQAEYKFCLRYTLASRTSQRRMKYYMGSSSVLVHNLQVSGVTRDDLIITTDRIKSLLDLKMLNLKLLDLESCNENLISLELDWSRVKEVDGWVALRNLALRDMDEGVWMSTVTELMKKLKELTELEDFSWERFSSMKTVARDLEYHYEKRLVEFEDAQNKRLQMSLQTEFLKRMALRMVPPPNETFIGEEEVSVTKWEKEASKQREKRRLKRKLRQEQNRSMCVTQCSTKETCGTTCTMHFPDEEEYHQHDCQPRETIA